MKYRRYTEEEKELVLSDKYTIAELAVMLGRTRRSVSTSKYSFKNGSSVSTKHAWTEEEVEMLRAGNFTVKEICEKLKVSEDAVRRKMSLSGIKRNTLIKSYEAIIIFSRVAGKTIKQIADDLGMNYETVKYIIRKIT